MEQVVVTRHPNQIEVHASLTKGLEPAEIKILEGAFGRSKRVLKLLNNYFQKESARGLAEMDSPAAFEGADWASRHAFYAGYRSAMRKGLGLTKT
jgi:hypothetical protein